MDRCVHGNETINSISVKEDITTGHGNQEPQRGCQSKRYYQSNLLRKLVSNAYVVTFVYHRQPGFSKSLETWT